MNASCHYGLDQWSDVLVFDSTLLINAGQIPLTKPRPPSYFGPFFTEIDKNKDIPFHQRRYQQNANDPSRTPWLGLEGRIHRLDRRSGSREGGLPGETP